MSTFLPNYTLKQPLLKVNHLLPIACNVDSYQSSVDRTKVSGILGAIDDNPILEGEEAYKIAHLTCQRFLDSEEVNEDFIFTILKFLEVLRSRAKSFTYLSKISQ